MRNILFLDMDGVLCTGRCSFMANEILDGITHNYLDKEAVSYILTICKKYNFEIVVSSVWRGNDNFIAMMRPFGFTSLNFHDDWRTKNIDVGKRGIEIQDWLDRHEGEYHSYVIFEDEPFDLLDHHKDNHLVKCDTYNGILFSSILEFKKRITDLNITEIKKK